MNVNVYASRKAYFEFLKNERETYFKDGRISFEQKFRLTPKYLICKYNQLLRKYEYLCYQRDNSRNYILSKYWVLRVKNCDRKKNKLGILLGLEITPYNMGKGVRICHQNVIINGNVGDGCVLHGNNVIGNKKSGSKRETPTLGKNVDVGVGAIVIGNVEIADNCVIGAGSVVTKSFLLPGTIIAGVPAKEINRLKD